MSVQNRSSPKPLSSDYLHYSAYEGKLDKVQNYLKEFCVYQKCSSNLTALLYSLSNRKLDVFKELWQIYERDIKFVREQIESGRELNHPIFIGFGVENIEEIEQMMKQYTSDGDSISDVIVLLKSDNFTPTKVIKLNSNNENFSTIVKVIGACIENGVLDLNERNDRDEALVDIAIYNGLADVAANIMEYGVIVDVDRVKTDDIPHGQKDDAKAPKDDSLTMGLSGCKNIDNLLDGSWDDIKQFLDRTGASVDELVCSSGLNLFHAAIKSSQPEIAEKLWDLKPNYKTAGLDGYLPIHDAIRKGFKNLVSRMLTDDTDVILQQDRSGYNCLHHMAMTNWLDEVTAILEKQENLSGEIFKNVGVGISFLKTLFGLKHAIAELIIKKTINSVSEDTFYAILNTVAGSSSSSILKFLLESRKVDLAHGPESPIIVALRHNQLDSAKLLLQHAECDCLNKIFDGDHNNLLKYVIFLNRGTQYTGDTIDENARYNELNPILDDLLAKGVDYKNINSSGKNLLHIATDGCNIYAITKLLELGVDENHKDNSGFPPIYYAKNIPSIKLFTPTSYADLPTYLFVDSPTLLEYILENGANADAANAENQTALYFTTRLDVCKILLKHKANVNHIDTHGNTPIHAAFSRSVYKTATYLLEADGANFTLLDLFGRSYLIYFLVTYQKFPKLYESPAFLEMLKAHCNDIDEFHKPYLHTAIEKNITLAKLLLSQENIDINLRNTETGDTSLHCAAYFNKYEIISELLKRELDINVLNNLNQTPLHMAARRQHLEAVDILLQHNANVDLADNDGQTPLHEAAQKEESGELFCSLLMKTSQPKAVNKNEKSPCDLLPEQLRKMFYFL